MKIEGIFDNPIVISPMLTRSKTTSRKKVNKVYAIYILQNKTETNQPRAEKLSDKDIIE